MYRPCTKQQQFKVGYHYKPTSEEAQQSLVLLQEIKFDKLVSKHVKYADLRQFTITE
jgi:hypothetical protein